MHSRIVERAKFPGDARETWLTAIPSLIPAARAGDLAAVAALVRVSLFLKSPPAPLVYRGRMLTARQHPDGHFGSLAVTARRRHAQTLNHPPE